MELNFQAAPDWYDSLPSIYQEEFKSLPWYIKKRLINFGEEGFNNNLVKIALSLSEHCSKEATTHFLYAAGAHYSKRKIRTEEVDKAIAKAHTFKNGGSGKSVKWSKYDKKAEQAVIQKEKDYNLESFREEFGLEDSNNYLFHLFEPQDLICVSDSPKVQKLWRAMPLAVLRNSPSSLFLLA